MWDLGPRLGVGVPSGQESHGLGCDCPARGATLVNVGGLGIVQLYLDGKPTEEPKEDCLCGAWLVKVDEDAGDLELIPSFVDPRGSLARVGDDERSAATNVGCSDEVGPHARKVPRHAAGHVLTQL